MMIVTIAGMGIIIITTAIIITIIVTDVIHPSLVLRVLMHLA